MSERGTDYLSTENLAVGYHGKALIRDISLSLKKGEIIALVGPNGAGKSTIIKSIIRELVPVGGTVVIDGRNLSQMTGPDLAKKMSVVLTGAIRPELMTVYDVVAMGRYPHTGRMGRLNARDKEQIRHAMELVDIGGIADRDFDEISDGQRQRVLLARAICQEPEVIVLDEPTSFLDIRYKLELIRTLRHMAAEQKTAVLLSMHEIDLAQKAADKIVCVKGDTISAFGTPEEIFTEERIRRLYDLSDGSYDPLFGSIELPKPEGDPKVFVISSGNSAIPTYRKLQKEGIPFAAGILYPQDADYQVAKYLAQEVVTEEPFEEISEETLRRAMETAQRCGRVINTGVKTGHMNRRLKELISAVCEHAFLSIT